MESLVSTQWLADALGQPDLRILDASYFLPVHQRDARAEFEAGHIKGARFMELATLIDAADPRPNMLPSPDAFADRMRALGVGDGDRILLYDDTPLRTAARAWWMLRLFGARDVAILDGGLAKWRDEGRPLEAGAASSVGANFTARPAPDRIVDKAFMLANVETQALPVADARGADRFAGGPPDAHGIEGGHIPGSASLPYTQLLNADGTYKDRDSLRATFAAAGIDPAKPFVATCGSGVTACVILFAAHLLGQDQARLYDGSWSEWGADPATPKARQ